MNEQDTIVTISIDSNSLDRLAHNMAVPVGVATEIEQIVPGRERWRVSFSQPKREEALIPVG